LNIGEKKVPVQPSGDMLEEPILGETQLYDVDLIEKNVIPRILHGVPDQILDTHTNNIGFFQYLTKHYSERDLLADVLFVTKNAKHRKEHHPVVKEVISQSLKHLPELHNHYFS